MKQFFLLISLFFLISSISAFNCPTVTDEVDCTSMTGCFWNTGSSTCSGSFSPSCTIPNCYYVDPVNGLDSQTGEADTPFLTLGPALTALLAKTGTIFILNPISFQEVKLLAPATVTGTVEIKAYFTQRKYVLSLTDFVVPSPAQPAFSISANKLTITQALINNKTAKTGLTTIFDIVGATAQLSYSNVSIYEYQGSIMLVNIGTAYTGAKFSFEIGKYIGTSFIFNIAAGTHTLVDVDFIDVKGSAYIFKVGTSLTLTNIFVQTGGALLLNLSDSTTITATNITFDGYNGNFIRGTYVGKLALSNSLFKNIVQTSPTPFIYFKNKPAAVTHTITSCTFQDIQVRASLFLMETNAFATTMTSVVMNNIKKIKLLPHQKTAEDSSYESMWPGGVCFLGRDTIALRILHSVFTNIYSHCIGLATSALEVTNTTFDNSDIDPTYEALITSSTTIDSFSESDGVSFINFQDGTSDVAPLGKVTITTSKFISNKIHPKYGGALRFTGVFAQTSLTITYSQFIDLGAGYGGAIYLDNPVSTMSSGNDIYQDNIAINGGAIYRSSIVTETVQTGNSHGVAVTSGTFSNNQAFNKGGSIYLDYQKFSLKDSILEDGRAKHGGSIYYRQINYKMAGASNSMSNNTFKNNFASISGGAIKILFDASELNETSANPNNYEDCTDYKGLAISDGKPLYFIFSFYDLLSTVKEATTSVDFSQWITNSTLTTLSSTINSTSFPSDFILTHKSGHTLGQIIKVEVYDDRHEIADYIHQEIVSATITDVQNTISEFTSFLASSPVTFSFQRGVFLMKSSITMVGEPQTTATLTLAGDIDTSNILSDAYLLMNQDFQVFFTDCDVGDVFDPTTRVCDTCDEGFYSLLDPYQTSSCIPCDQKRAFCLGGSQIAPKPGYWRYNINTDNMIECPQSSACLGGWFNETYSAQGECEFPYEGNLCNQCAPNYAKFGSSDSCVSCKTDKMYYVKFVGFFAIQIIALLYGIKCNVNKTNHIKGDTEENKAKLANLNNEDFQSNIMKITINFLQISSIVIQYNFDWPVFITNIVNATNKIIPSDKDGFSVDCIVAMITGNNQYINFIKLIITLVQPYIMWSALILVYLFYLKLKKETIKGNPKVKKNVVVLFIITAFILQPNIMQATLEMFRCVNYGSESDPIYFMKEDSEIQCWTYLHVFWSVIIALPNFILWTIALPLILLKVLRKNAKNLDNSELYAKYSFVYEGLKKDKYYWEFVILTRKSLLIIIFVFLNFISSQSQAFATFLVILTFGAIHYVKWPYDDERLNRAELLSLLTSGIMVYCGMFFLAKGGNDWINTILIIFSAACNLAFYLYIAKNLIQSFRLKALHLTKQAQNVKKKLSEMKEKYKEKKKSNKSGSNTSNFSSSVEEKKNMSGIEIKDLSAVLNQIQENTPGLPLSPLERLLNIGNGDDDQDHSSIPTENNENYGRSKTVYNEERVNNSNHSVFRKSFVLPRQEQKDSFSRADSGLTLMTPEMLNDMLNIFKSRKSSPTQDYNSNNSNDSPFLGRTFTVNEKLYEPQNNMSKDADDDDDN